MHIAVCVRLDPDKPKPSRAALRSDLFVVRQQLEQVCDRAARQDPDLT